MSVWFVQGRFGERRRLARLLHCLDSRNARKVSCRERLTTRMLALVSRAWEFGQRVGVKGGAQRRSSRPLTPPCARNNGRNGRSEVLYNPASSIIGKVLIGFDCLAVSFHRCNTTATARSHPLHAGVPDRPAFAGRSRSRIRKTRISVMVFFTLLVLSLMTRGKYSRMQISPSS